MLREGYGLQGVRRRLQHEGTARASGTEKPAGIVLRDFLIGIRKDLERLSLLLQRRGQ
jgi:hypothetical protein